MVWLHLTPPPAPGVPALGATLAPWLERLAARLLRGPGTGATAAALLAPPADRHFDAAEDGFADSAGRSGSFTRVTPLHRLPEAPAAALAAAPAQPTQFHALEAEDIPLVLVLSRRAGPGLACLDWLADHGLPFRRIAALHPTARVWAAPRGALLLVDLDTLGGVGPMAEPLLRLRLGRPDLPVILLSEEVAGHDFGLERLSLADITLRLPCAYASFEFALAEAPINNAVWQERLAIAPRTGKA